MTRRTCERSGEQRPRNPLLTGHLRTAVPVEPSPAQRLSDGSVYRKWSAHLSQSLRTDVPAIGDGLCSSWLCVALDSGHGNFDWQLKEGSHVEATLTQNRGL